MVVTITVNPLMRPSHVSHYIFLVINFFTTPIHSILLLRTEFVSHSHLLKHFLSPINYLSHSHPLSVANTLPFTISVSHFLSLFLPHSHSLTPSLTHTFSPTLYAQVWLPNQLQLEYDQKLWLSVTAPVTAFFDDKDNEVFPLWSRIVSSFPSDRLKSPAKKQLKNDISENNKDLISLKSQSEDNDYDNDGQ